MEEIIGSEVHRDLAVEVLNSGWIQQRVNFWKSCRRLPRMAPDFLIWQKAGVSMIR